MKIFAIAALFAAAAVAQPLDARSGRTACPQGLYSNAQCCDAQVLGIIGIGCNVPNKQVHDGAELHAACSKTGKEALCCVLPVADQALFCQNAIGSK